MIKPGDFFRGLVGPGSGLREAVRGNEDEWEKDLGTSIERFFTAGSDAFEKHKEKEKMYRDRIKILKGYNVENKELAIALADQPQESFERLIEAYIDESSKHKERLLMRTFVGAEGIPTEDVIRGDVVSMGGEAPIDKEVIADLDKAGVDEAVERLVGKVRPGTLDRNQETTFKSALQRQFAMKGFLPEQARKIMRREALEEAMAQRPPGVSKEEWLGYMEDDIEIGPPSEVTFRGVPYSREADLTLQNLELAHSKLVREDSDDEEARRLDNSPLSASGIDVEAINQFAEILGIEFNETTTLKDFKQQTGASKAVLDLYNSLLSSQKSKSGGGLTVGSVHSLFRTLTGDLKSYFGAADVDSTESGGLIFGEKALYASDIQSMITDIRNVVAANIKKDMVENNMHYLDAYNKNIKDTEEFRDVKAEIVYRHINAVLRREETGIVALDDRINEALIQGKAAHDQEIERIITELKEKSNSKLLDKPSMQRMLTLKSRRDIINLLRKKKLNNSKQKQTAVATQKQAPAATQKPTGNARNLAFQIKSNPKDLIGILRKANFSPEDEREIQDKFRAFYTINKTPGKMYTFLLKMLQDYYK